MGVHLNYFFVLYILYELLESFATTIHQGEIFKYIHKSVDEDKRWPQSDQIRHHETERVCTLNRAIPYLSIVNAGLCENIPFQSDYELLA